MMCCCLVLGSATHTPPRRSTRPRVLTLDKLYLDLGKVGHLSACPTLGTKCHRVNPRGNRTPDPWHTSPHSKTISQRQLPLAKGFGQCRHSCYRQTQVTCCHLVVGSATNVYNQFEPQISCTYILLYVIKNMLLSISYQNF